MFHRSKEELKNYFSRHWRCKKVFKSSAPVQKVLVWFLRPSKKYSARDTVQISNETDEVQACRISRGWDLTQPGPDPAAPPLLWMGSQKQTILISFWKETCWNYRGSGERETCNFLCRKPLSKTGRLLQVYNDDVNIGFTVSSNLQFHSFITETIMFMPKTPKFIQILYLQYPGHFSVRILIRSVFSIWCGSRVAESLISEKSICILNFLKNFNVLF